MNGPKGMPEQFGALFLWTYNLGIYIYVCIYTLRQDSFRCRLVKPVCVCVHGCEQQCLDVSAMYRFVSDSCCQRP